MKQKKWIYLAAFLLLGGRFSARGETVVVNLDKAIEIALSESPTVKVADKEIERKGFVKKEAISKLIPTINAQGQWTYTIKKQVMSMNIPGVGEQSLAVGSTNSYSGGLSLALPIVAPTLWQNLNVTDADIERSVEAARTSRLNMVKSVKTAFYNVLLSENSYEVIRKNYEQTVANFENTKARVSVGAASEYDMIRAEVQVRNLEPNVYQAESAVRSAYLQLKALLAVNPELDLKVEGDFLAYEQEMYSSAIEVDSVSISNNPNLRKIDREIDYMNATLKMQWMQRLPSISLNANYSLMTLSNDFDFKAYKWHPYSTVGLSINIPIFEGLAKFHRERQTKIGIESIKLQRIDVENSLITQRQTYVDNIKKCIKQVESSKKGVSSATRGYEIAKKRYDVGAGSFLEYNDAEVALLQAQLAYNQALFGYITAKADLENLQGSYPLE